ncbi:MAG: tRNA (adenosine(37)-N6)-threonylcarbamoyltransferase complex transferase subunit TsaD [Bacilli bacterium]
MKDTYILSVESSCDETSVSIVKNGIEDKATSINTQIDTHKLYGGVVPEVASRMHLNNFVFVLDDALKKADMKLTDMDAFACTYGPGLLGSLLVGLEGTKTLSMIYEKPFIKVNHMMGHIYANGIGKKLDFPLLCLVISGGHTDLIKMNDEYNFNYIGSTLDDAIGECFDKVARIIGYPYPGGPNVEAAALRGKNSYKMPVLMNDDSFNFSFSGIKSFVNNLVHNEEMKGNSVNKDDIACSFQYAVTSHLVDKTRKAIRKIGVKNFIVAGGVASNNYVRGELKKMADEENVIFSVPEKKYCTDNATMIGAAAYVLYKHKEYSGLDTNAKSNINL